MFESENDSYLRSLNNRARVFLQYKYSSNSYSLPLWVFDNIKKKGNARILELGCGNGIFWKLNESRIPENWEITLADSSKNMLRNAKIILGNTSKNINIIEMRDNGIRFQDRTFDIVIANQITLNSENSGQIFSEIRRVLKDNGVFYTTTTDRGYMQELFEIIKEFKSIPKCGCRWAGDSFSIHNGEELLREFFSEVELKIYENALVITDPFPFADYAFSLNSLRPGQNVISQSEKGMFADFIKKKIDKEGSITIPARLGIFINRNSD